MKLNLVCPAFKIRPHDYLRLATQMTISQRYSLASTESIPAKNLHPVTLPHNKAALSLKVIMANSAVSRTGIFPLLPKIQFRITDYFLHYLPFEKTSHELHLKNLGVTINQRVLDYGRSL